MNNLELVKKEELQRVLKQTGMNLYNIGRELVENWDSDLQELFSIPSFVVEMAVEEYNKVQFPVYEY